jgi:hypothetical protein
MWCKDKLVDLNFPEIKVRQEDALRLEVFDEMNN